jgi:hypothetical protein
MPLDIPEFAMRAFETRWGHTVQQMVSKLRDKVTVDSFSGKEKVYKDLSTLTWTERLNRLSASTPQEIQGFKRKLTKRDFKCQVIFDRKDKDYIVSELSSPGSDTEVAMRASWNRKVDEMVAQRVSATVYGGAEPYVTPITVSSSRQVAVDYVPSGSAANSGLTPWKIINLKKKYELAEIFIDGEGSEEAFLAIGPKQEEDLWGFVGADHKTEAWAAPLARFLNGESKKLFGFNIVKSNRLTLNSSTDVRLCPSWVKSAMMVAPENMVIKVDELPEQDHAIQLAGYAARSRASAECRAPRGAPHDTSRGYPAQSPSWI